MNIKVKIKTELDHFRSNQNNCNKLVHLPRREHVIYFTLRGESNSEQIGLLSAA